MQGETIQDTTEESYQTASGKNIYIDDGDSSKFLLTSLQGESSQKTRSGKNFFDKTKFKAINKATYTYSNGIYAITPLGTGNVSLDIYINLPAGTYTYSGNGSDATQVKNSSGTTIANNISSSNTTYTITEEGSFIRFNFGTGTSTDAFTLDTNNIQIESGSTATDYEEYGVMPSPDYPSEIENLEGNIEFKVEGKNRFDKDTAQELDGSTAEASPIDTGLMLNIPDSYNWTSSRFLLGYTADLLGKTIRVSTDIVLDSNFKDYLKASITIGHGDATGMGYTKLATINGKLGEENNLYVEYTLPSEIGEMKNGIKLILQANGTEREKPNDTYINFTNLIITIDDEDMTYEPYKSQTVTFPLGEGEKLYQGSFLNDNGKNHERKQVIFDGTENWGYTSNCVYTNAIIDLVKKPVNNSVIAAILCNTYLKDSLANCYNNVTDKRIAINKDGFLYIYDTDFTSYNDWKTYLADQYANGTPVILEYDLAEPETVPYTEEQQEAWNELQSIKLFDGINNISSDAYADIKYNYVYASPSPDYPSEIENLEGNIEFKVEGKNSIDILGNKPSGTTETINGVTFTILEDGKINVNGKATAKTIFYIFTNKKIPLSDGYKTFKGGSSNVIAQLYVVNNGKSTYPTSYGTSITNNYINSILKYAILVVNEGVTVNNETVYIQLERVTEEKPEPTDYEPYKSQVATFPLGEGQKLMEGSYLADDGIHHTRKQVVLTGEETIAMLTYGDNKRFQVVPANYNPLYDRENSRCLCNYFKADYIGTISNADLATEPCFFIHRTFILFTMTPDTNITTVDEFKSYLSTKYTNGTPIVVEYELAEPETVPYTEEQQEAWNELQSIKLFDGINNISSDAYADIKYNYVYASPSPDYPSPIENIEGRNKFNANGGYDYATKTYKADYNIVNSNKIIITNQNGAWNRVGCTIAGLKTNTEYTVSADITNNAGLSCGFYSGQGSDLQTSTAFKAIYIYTTDENGTLHFQFYTNMSGTVSSDEVIYDNIQLEEGTVATPYVPYNSLEFKVEGKNRFNKSQNYKSSNVEGTYWNITELDTGVRIQCTYSSGVPNIKYLLNDLSSYVGKTVRMKCNFKNSASNIGRYGLGICDNNANSSTAIVKAFTNKTGETISFVVPELEEGKTYLYAVLYSNATGTQTSGNYVDYTDIVITIDDEDMTYEPYKSQVAYFPLSEGQKLMEGSYLADDGVHNARKQRVFDGDEDWVFNFTTSSGLYVYYVILSDRKQRGDCLCNYFKKVSSTEEKGMYSGNSLNFIVEGISTLAEWKTWLSEHPITVEYDLAELETVPYAEEQRAAFNSINQLYLFMGQNTIYSDALISAIYITQMTDGITTNYLNILNSKYIDIAQRNTIHPMFKIELLDIYENIVDEITGDISTDTSGSISVNYQQGVRRSISLTFIDTDSRFIPDSKGNLIWANKKFKVFVGLKDEEKDSIYWFSQGVYYFTNATSSRDGADCKTTITGVDKFGKFGSELGYNQLESTYLIPAGTNIYSAIKGILNMDIGNGQPIDPIEPILDPIYIDEVCPYDIKKSPSEYLSEILIELADILGCDIYYDINGRLRIDNGTIDISYSNKASIWNFSDILPEYSNSSVSTNFVDFINAVKVVGNNINDQIYEYTAYNNNPESPTRVDLIGKKMKYIDSATVYNEDRAKDYAVYKLNTLSILQLAINFSSTLLPHLDVNKIITITDKHFNYNMQRFIIQSLTIPLSYSELMTISASNVASLPYYEGGNT